jgi:phosphoglycolate phosphatase
VISPPTIVFDLDGTLVDTAGDLVATLNVILGREGMGPVDFDAAVAMIGSGARVMLQSAFAAQGRSLTQEKLEARFDDFLAHYDDHLVDTSKPYPGVEAALDRFIASGWRLAVCTNKSYRPALKLLGLLGLADRFAAITGRDTFSFRKPDPRHLTETIRRAGGEATDAVMVGDSATDVDTAIAAGVPVVAVTFGYSATPVAELGATVLIDHYDELYDTVAEISRPPSRPIRTTGARSP